MIDQLTGETDPFPQVTSPKFPKKVADILRSNGRNVGAMEKSLQDAINAGGSQKEQAVINAYNLFDEIQGTSQYRSVLESYQPSSQSGLTKPSRSEETNTGLAAPKSQPVITPVAVTEEIPTQEGNPVVAPVESTDTANMGVLETGIKAGWNAIVDKVKGLGQAVVGANYLFGNSEAPALASLGEQTLTPQEILPGDSALKIKLKKDINAKIESEKLFSAKSKSVGDWVDQAKAEIPKQAQQSPIYFDKAKGEVNTDRMSDYRAWSNMIGGSIGGMATDIAVSAAASALSKGKSPAIANALKNGARAITFASSSAQMFPGYLQDGLDNGLSYGDALKVAGPMAVVNGAVELVGLEFVMNRFKFGKEEARVVVRDVLNSSAKSAIKQLAGKEITTEVFLDAIAKTTRQAFKDLGHGTLVSAYKAAAQKLPSVAKTIVKGALPESLEEGFQSSIEATGKRMYNSLVESKGGKPGEGQFDVNTGEDVTNTLMGMFVGGLVGGMGSGIGNNSPKLYDQTMFAYANTDIRHQLGQGAQSLQDIKSQGKIFNKIEEWRNNGEFNTQQNGQTILDEAKYQQVVDNANLMYDTAWEFRDYNGFDDTDRSFMFKIAKTRKGIQDTGNQISQTKQQVDQIDQMLADYDNLDPDEYGEKPSRQRLESDRANIAKELGQQDPTTGLYQKEQIFQDRANRIENIIKQTIPAINDPETKLIGRRFLSYGLDAVEALQNPDYDTFEISKEIPLSDGSFAVQSDADTGSDSQIRQLVVQEAPGSVLDQLDKSDYKPVERYQYRTEPIDDFSKFTEAITSPSRNVARDTTRPYNVGQDASEVIRLGQELAQQAIAQPEQAQVLGEQIGKAYDLYNNISQHKDALDDGVQPLTQEQFAEIIGLPKTQVEPEVANQSSSDESIPAQQVSTVKSLLNKPVSYQGQRANLSLDGQTVIASPIGSNQIIEVGNIDEIGELNPTDYGIQPEESQVQIQDDGNITVRDKTYRNGYSNPLSAINRNNKGDITSVTLDAPDGTKRTFRDQTAQDIAYELILKNTTNGADEEFNRFVEGNEFAQREIVDAENASVTEASTQQDTNDVSGSPKSTDTVNATSANTINTSQSKNGLLNNEELKKKLIEIEKEKVFIKYEYDDQNKITTSQNEIINQIKEYLDKYSLPYRDIVSNEKQSRYSIITNNGEQIEVLSFLSLGGKPQDAVLSKAKYLNYLKNNELEALRLSLSKSNKINTSVTLKNISNYAKRIVEGKTLLKRLSPEIERGRAEGGIRNVEATIISSRAGDSKSISRGKRDKIAALREYAKKEGIWFDDPSKSFGKIFASGAESTVYISDDNTYVHKVNNLQSHENIDEFFDRIGMHNYLFPESKYELIGFGYARDSEYEFAAIVKQQFIQGSYSVAEIRVKNKMKALGFKNEGIGEHTFGDFKVSDLNGFENVVADKSGNLFFIDPLIELNTPEMGFGGTAKINPITNEDILDETTTERPDTISDTEVAPTLESEYIRARELNQITANVDQAQEQLRRAIGLADQIAESVEDGEKINDSITGLINAIGSVNRESESANRQFEKIPLEDGNQDVTEPGNSSDSETGTVQAESAVVKKGTPKAARRIKNQEILKALNKFPDSIQDEIDQYFLSGGKITSDAIGDQVNGKGNQEKKYLIGITNNKTGLSVDALAHKLWEESSFNGKIETQEYRDAVEETIRQFPGLSALMKRVNTDSQDNLTEVTDEEVQLGIDPEFARLYRDSAPFSFTTPEDTSNQIYPLLNQIAKAFPNITVNVPTKQEYQQGLAELGVRELPYGYISPNGSINLDPSRLNANTAFHEYGHIWTMWAEKNNPELYTKGVELIKNGKYVEAVKSSPNYQNLTQKQIYDEALATAIGDKGESFVMPARKRGFKEWMNELFNDVKKFFGLRDLSPEQITDLDFESFINGVVADLVSGETISQMSSQDVSDILRAAGQEPVETELTEEDIQDNLNEYGDILFSWKPPQKFGVRPGETVGSAKDYKTRAESMLNAAATSSPGLLGPITNLSAIDKATIDNIQKETGWEYKGNGEWDFDISATTNKDLGVNEFLFTPDDQFTRIEIKSPASNTKGLIAEAITEGTKLALEGGIAGTFMDVSFRTMETQNIESVTKLIDDENGYINQFLTEMKRQGTNRKDYAMVLVMEDYLNAQSAMAPFSTSFGGSNEVTVKKIEVPIIIEDENGKVKQLNVWMPVATAMNLARTDRTQKVMSDAYLTKPDINGISEKRTAVVLDNRHFNSKGEILDPHNKSILFGEKGLRLGAHLKGDTFEVQNAKGNLVPLTNAFGKKATQVSFMMNEKEMAKLVNRFERGVGAEEGEVDAYSKVTKFLNNKDLQALIKNENDIFLNPSKEFNSISFYAPLTTYNETTAHNSGSSLSPNLEDSRRLHEREGRPDAIVIQDDLRASKYYLDGVTKLLGNARLAHNVKYISDAISKENANIPHSEKITNYLKGYAAHLQGTNSLENEVDKSRYLKFINWFTGKYIPYLFRAGLSISLTQSTTYMSGAGHGYIDDKYLWKAKGTFGRLTVGAYKDTISLAGSTVNQSTGQGTKGFLGQTTETKELDYLLGKHISDPVKKKAHLKKYATIISRVLYGNNRYVAGIDYAQNTSAKKSFFGLGSQVLSTLDNWFDETLMAPIRRTDRAVILSFVEAAKLQATDMGLVGEAFDDWVSKAAENTMIASNQMSDISDTTGLQRSDSPFTRFLTMFSGQTQKLYNSLFQATVDWHKYGNKDTTPEPVKKLMKHKMRTQYVTNFIAVPAFIAAFRIGAQVIKSLAKGDELKDKEDYVKTGLFDWLRLSLGIAPGLAGQVISSVISYIDLEKWTDGILEVPGLEQLEETAEQVFNAASKILVGDGDEITKKQVSQILVNNSKLLAIYTGFPKFFNDIFNARFLETGKDAPKVRKKDSNKTPEELEEESFDKIMEGIE